MARSAPACAGKQEGSGRLLSHRTRSMGAPNKHSASARGKYRLPEFKSKIGVAVFEAELGFAAQIAPLRRQVVRPNGQDLLRRAFE
jgi:hypothetical protein